MVNNKNYSNNRNIQARNTQKEVQVYQRMSKGWHCGKGNAILDRPGEYISTDKAAWASLPKVLGRSPACCVPFWCSQTGARANHNQRNREPRACLVSLGKHILRKDIMSPSKRTQ